MSESEDFDLLKVTELQNELKKRGLDTKGRKADLIDRLRQAANNGIEADGTTINNTDFNDVIKGDTSSPSSAIEDETSVERTEEEEELPFDESPSNKKRPLIDDEKLEESEDNSMEQQTNEIEKDDENNPNDDLSKQKRKKKSRWGSEQDEDESTTKQTSDSDDDDNDVDDDNDHTIDDSSSRHRSSRQHDDDRHYSSRHSEKSPDRELQLPEEETVQFNAENVVLDFYTSDLNLTVNTDCLSASSKSNDALCFLWAGVRATYGFQQGKICYEIRITQIIDCPQMPDSETEKFGIRIGWSNLSSGLHALQLGEFNDSFAYTSTGKKMRKTNDELIEETYGESFGPSDVIASYIDFDENFIRISFTKNGEDYGQAFEFSKNDSREFYPHILVKNVKFECNFGQLENSWSQIKSDYIFAQNVPLADRIRCSEPILEKSQCQAILLSGLNGSGKTTWAKKYIDENPKKDFNLLNIEHALSKMTIDGKSPAVKDRNDGLMLRVNIALQKLIEVAAQRRRNYIIDHVNTTRESQVKRQRLFTGYQRIGVAIIPDDEELRRRVEKLEKSENISIPSQWIREAKSRFYFPQKSSSLEDVIYPELDYEEAKSLYDRARRDSDQYRSSSRYERYDDYHSSRNNNRNRYDDRDRDHRSRDRDRYARSRSRERDRRSSREDSRFSSSSSHRNDNFRGGYSRGGGGGGGGGRYSDNRQDSRNNQRGGYHEGGGSNYRGRGGGGYHNQSNDDWRGGGYQQQQRNDFGGGRGRGGGFDNNRNQYNNRGSYHDNQRSGGFRQDSNNQPRGRQFNDYDKNQHQGGGGGGGSSGGRGFMQNNNNNNNFNQQQDRQSFGSRPPMHQQQQHSFHNQQQQRPQPLLQNPPSNQQQQFPSHLTQQTANNPNLSLQGQNHLGINSLSNPANITQQNSLDPWLALCAAALNPQSAATQQPQQDANSLTQQWANWLKTAQMAQAAQQIQPQLTVQQPDPQQQQQQQQAQLSDASAIYYQAYYAQLAAAQQAAAAASGGVAPPGSGDK